MSNLSTVFNTTDGILEPLQEIEDALKQIQAGKFLFLAAFTILVWDHACSLSEEVHGVWKKRKNYILWIFLFVRYYSPLAMIVVFYGFFSTSINRSKCERWMYFATVGVSIPLMVSAGVLMMFRVWALYNRNKLIIFVLSSFLAAQTVIGVWQWTEHGGTPAPDPLDNYQYHFCIYLPPKARRSSTIYLFMELAFDTLVFVLTICRTTYMHLTNLPAMIGEKSSCLIDNLITDGALYFAAIFSINLAWVIMILHAPTNLRAVLAIPSSCLTTVLICRLTLNLRIIIYGPAHVSQRTYNDIILSDFETGSGSNSPSKAEQSMSMASSEQSLRSAPSDDDSSHASAHDKSGLAWQPWSESKGEDESVRKSRSSVSSDSDEDEGSRDEKAYSRSIVDHDMVREVPRGRTPQEDGGGAS